MIMKMCWQVLQDRLCVGMSSRNDVVLHGTYPFANHLATATYIGVRQSSVSTLPGLELKSIENLNPIFTVVDEIQIT